MNRDVLMPLSTALPNPSSCNGYMMTSANVGGAILNTKSDVDMLKVSDIEKQMKAVNYAGY